MEVLTSQRAIEAQGFSFAYPGATQPLFSLDWVVPEGSFQLLVGATGSGKTTLLRCLKQALCPVGQRSGTLSVCGELVDEMTAYDAASKVGYVSQNPENQIVCDSVWHELAFGLENLGVPQNEMRRRVAEVAHFFGIEPWFRRSVEDLSGGQRHMVALASVLVMQPRLLLLDEPTAQLDPVAEKNFLHALFRINRELGITVVVATHAPEAMRSYATSAFELSCGELHSLSLDRFEAPLLDEELAFDKCLSSKNHSDYTAVVVNDVYVRYNRQSDWVLRGCTLKVVQGEVHGIVGGNGCGKSTLLKTVAGMVAGERGSVKNHLVNHQAFLPQQPKSLFVCDTVGEELKEWQPVCGYSDQEIDDFLIRFNLDRLIHQHPYDLSGGQMQKLALAKLLLSNPQLLLLDEPTKGLDAASKYEVVQCILERVQKGLTVLVATHDLACAAVMSDRVTMLFDGEATCTEPTGDFFRRNLFYQPTRDAFFRLWMKERG